ncbi:hypothetical protein LNQ81_17770 [Myroides sp. M-43]|uniref:hypothetical protein n=1 Tax=Myroides oncorhynchi TaxID=2893756 RepID=UPI001E31EF5F|nr:hypothetical protein [Myroides oncorhynchi]MCC9044520.1 hypothetical protein [Myroides oncorhynchi]
MKKYIITCAALFAMSYFGYAQVGIGTNKPTVGSALDIKADDKGVLLPRVALTAKTQLAPIKGTVGDASLKGLIVYNINPTLDPTSEGKSEGFYYWNGLGWDKISSTAEVIKLIKDSTSDSVKNITEIINIIVNEGGDNALKGSSVVLYDFTKEEFYTLVKDANGKVVKSSPIDLTNAIRKAETNTFIRVVKDANKKTTGYLYFSEEAIKIWQKENPTDAQNYVKNMKKKDGVLLDIVGDVTNNLEEILNSKKEFFENYITNIKNNVSIKTEGDRIYLIYKDDKGNEIKIDLSQLETETFVRTITKEEAGKTKIMGYIHFNEAQISKWIKAHPGQANSYKTDMKNEDGTFLDVIGAISNNFKEIVENNSEYITKIIQETKGNVTVKTENGKTYLVYRDDKGNEVKLDLSSMEIVTFSREIKNDKKVTTGYVYFNEDAIAKWIKENALMAPLYQTQMPDDLGFKMDVVGAVSNNFEEIINKEENKKYITNVINESKGNVTVKVVNGKTVLVYKDKDGNEQVIDLSSQEVDTFIIEVKDATSKKVTGYRYFSEEAITTWQKANPDIAGRYKTMMPADVPGTSIDVVGTVSNSFEEIINKEENKKFITNVINESKGNVTVKVVDGKTVLVYKDENNKEQIFDLSVLSVDTFIREVKDKTSGKVTGYIYFSEDVITTWQKANSRFADLYKDQMPDNLGTSIDVVGTVSNSFEEIINKEENKKFITNVINESKGNVTVKVVDGKTVLVYKDENNKEQIFDLSVLAVDTFVREVKDKTSGKVTGYIYFSEDVITTWQKANSRFADLYKDQMPDNLGTSIDVVGTVSNSFEEIINNGGNKELITNIVNKTGGNISVKIDENGKTILVYKDKDGKEQIFDISVVETETYIKEVKKTVKVNNVDVEKVVGYVYFSEEAINTWRKNPVNKGKDYKTAMLPADGKLIDVVGAVSQNFQEIINEGDNIKYVTEVIEKTKGAVSVEERNGKLVLVFVDDKGVKQEFDLSAQETETYIKEVKKTVKVNNVDVEKVVGYVYFSEEAINTWRKNPVNKGKDYKTAMLPADGKLIDVVGAVSQNFQEIINEGDNIKYVTEVIEKTKGAVSVEERNGKLVLVFVDDKGVKQEFDLSAQETETYIKEVKKTVKVNNVDVEKVVGYVYFSEEAINTWRKDPVNKGKDYKTAMLPADGKLIDVVGAVSQNFQEIINEGDNIKYVTEVIEKTKGAVSVEERNGKLILVFVDDKGVKQEFDLSAQETDTFVRIVPGKDSKGNDINLKYIYFSEAKIAVWLKANPGKDYKKEMPESDGIVIDVLSDVTNNLGDIINRSGDAFNNILNEYLIKGGNVYYGKVDPTKGDVLYTIVEENGAKVKKVLDLTNTIKEILTKEEFKTELKSAVAYDITEAVSETNIKFGNKVVSTFSSKAVVSPNDAEIVGVEAPDTLGRADINVFDIKLYTADGKLVAVSVTDIKYNNRSGLLDFTLGTGDIYTTIPAGTYKAVIYFTK